MLALLTSTMLVRVADEDEAADVAATMTEVMDAAIIKGWEKENVPPEEGRKICFPLGVLVQVVPDDVAF